MAKNGANPLLDAALDFARRGWPVFPCNPKNKQPLLAAQRDASGKAVKGTGGVSAARTDEATIRGWWLKWPMAQVGLACGFGRLFVLDFDPRHDEATGEEFTLERLKGEVEAQIGCALPRTLAARTQSGGVHLYFTWPDDDGPEIRNRGNLPLHVDVRGRGGYVIAPPSFMEDGKQYRWLHKAGPDDVEIVEAPAELVATLRAPKARPQADVAADQAAAPDPSPPRAHRPAGDRGDPSGASDDPVRRYALAALEAECADLARAPVGKRNIEINTSAFRIGQLVGAGALGLTESRNALEHVVAGMIASGGGDYEAGCKTVDNGLVAGQGVPRDLSDVREQAERRAAQYGDRGRSAGATRPATPAASARSDAGSAPFQSGRSGGNPVKGFGGREVKALTAAETARLQKLAAEWFVRRLEHAEPEKKALTAIAWGVGRRVAAGLIDEGAAKEALWPLCEDVAGLSHADIDQAIDDGFNKGFDPGRSLTDLTCALYPMTDMGNAERFRDRYGADFRFTTAKGWLGWDGRRWKVLDQDDKNPPAEVLAAVFDTIRSIQREARSVKDTGVRWGLIKKGKDRFIDDEDEGNPYGVDRWVPKGKDFVLLSAMISGWGRTSESAGKLGCIAGLAKRWLTLPIEDFDQDALAINVLNGTLRFRVVADGPNAKPKAIATLEAHRRDDLQTKLAPIEYDEEAMSPLYDGMLAWAQPDLRDENGRFVPGTGVAMRRYLHQVAGYSATGDTGEHQLWFYYGRGRNGKSVTIDSWCAALGDYSGTILIESFLDQGVKKRGDQATPDLAKLGGVRMLRASEPEQGAKLNAALIKLVTGGEPVSVRALHRGFFDLVPRFKLIISGNSKPGIAETDDGIWGRMRLVNWPRHIDKPEPDVPDWPKKDIKLGAKIKAAELPGVFNHIVRGLLDWLEYGLVEPAAVASATAEYREHNDPVSRFLKACTRQEAGAKIKSSHLHEVFVAWAKATGATAREWTNKGLTDALLDKGLEKKTSNGVQWLGMRLVREAADFVDPETGKVRDQLPDLEEPAGPAGETFGEDGVWPDEPPPPPPAGSGGRYEGL